MKQKYSVLGNKGRPSLCNVIAAEAQYHLVFYFGHDYHWTRYQCIPFSNNNNDNNPNNNYNHYSCNIYHKVY